MKRMANRLEALERERALGATALADAMARLKGMEASLGDALLFNRVQAKRNDINVNLFTVILNELSLKLNMKGRQKEVRNEDALPLGINKICLLKYSPDGTETQQGGSTVAPEEAVVDCVAGQVLEAVAISLSGQTITSVDDKNLRRIKQIREFKVANGVPLNGLVSLHKNVTRFNQDAGLACNMTLEAKMKDGMHLCFGTDAERETMHHLSMCGNGDAKLALGAPSSDGGDNCSSRSNPAESTSVDCQADEEAQDGNDEAKVAASRDAVVHEECEDDIAKILHGLGDLGYISS